MYSTKVIIMFGAAICCLMTAIIGSVSCCAVESVIMPIIATEYAHTAYLDGDARTIEFRWSIGNSADFGVASNLSFGNNVLIGLLSVPTHGYISWGLSPNGGMPGANMLVMWVDDADGMAHVQDRYATDFVEPSVIADQKSSVMHYSGSQNATHTVVQFVRWIDAGCRNEHGISITNNAMHVIYAFGEADPDPSSGRIDYHGPSNRGSRTLYLIDDASGNFEQNKAAAWRDGVPFDYTAGNFRVPAQETTYHCKFHQLPEIATEMQIIGFEAIIDPNNAHMIHHMIVRLCDHDAFNASSPPKVASFSCYDTSPSELDENIFNCFSSSIWAWTAGGTGLYMPKDVGLPLTPRHSLGYFFIETHYNNPSASAGRVDNSGVRFFLINKNLRPRESSGLGIVAMLDETFIVPGNTPTFTIPAACHPACTQKFVPPNGTHVFSVLFHAHQLAQSIVLRHFRNGTELSPILGDQTYDYNYQQFRPTNVTLMPGDSLVVECNYSSAGRRRRATLGGLSTLHEMCMAAMYVTPPIPLIRCRLGVNATLLKVLTNTTDIVAPGKTSRFSWSSGKEYERNMTKRLKTIEWNIEKLPLVQALQDFYLNSEQSFLCESNEIQTKYVGYPQLATPWQPYKLATDECA